MISWLTLVSLLSSVIVYSLGEYVYLENRRSPQNRAFAAFCLVLGFWSFSEFMYRQAQTYHVAYLWVRAFSFAWPLSTPVFLHFVLLYTQAVDILRKKLTYVILYLPAVMTTVADNINSFTYGPIRAPWGYRIGGPKDPFLLVLTTGWSGVLGITALVLIWRFYRSTGLPEKKKQALLIGIGSATALIAGIITQIIIPLTGTLIPESATAFFTVLVIMVALAISRYRLFTVSPEAASREILSTMTDSLVIMDTEANIVGVNKTTREMLCYRQKELLGRPACVLFKEDKKVSSLLESALSGKKTIKSYRADYLSRTGETVPILFSVSCVRDRSGKVIGAVIIASDITELIKAEETRRIADFLQNFILNIPGRVECIEFGHLYRSATETALIGGDFFDIFELKHGKAGIVIGDVSGKGLQAATLTSLVRDTIKAYANEDISPALVLDRTNTLVEKIVKPGSFISVFFGIIDTASGLLTYCNAGHPAGLIKRRDGVALLNATSTVIGAFPDLDYADETVFLKAGDVLLLYTDGIVEARSNGYFFGEERLISLVNGLKSVTAEALPQLIFDEVMKFTGGKLSDDAAMLSLSLPCCKLDSQ